MLKKWCNCVGLYRRTNHNVRIAFISEMLGSLAQGIYGLFMSGNYLYLITGGSASMVGYAEGIQGTVQLLPGLVGGRIADRGRRDVVLRWTAIFFLFCIALFLVVLLAGGKYETDFIPIRGFLPWFDDNTHIGTYRFIFFTVVLCLVDSCFALSNATAQAILSDSVPTGTRSTVLSTLSMAIMLAYGCGPILSVVLFAAQGNDWTVPELSTTMAVGLLIQVTGAIVQLFYNDDACLHEESKALNEIEDFDFTDNRYSRIPFFSFTGDLIWGLGSGLMVKYYSIFYQNKEEGLGLSPVVVNVIFVVSPLLVSTLTGVALMLSKRIGRVQVELLFSTFDVVILVAMGLAYYEKFYHGASTPLANKIIITVLLTFRSSFATAPNSLRRSYLMDFVPKKKRAWWSSLDSVISLGWSGTASIGGIIVDRYGFHSLFLIGAFVHAVSMVTCTIPLLFLVPKEEVAVPATRKRQAMLLLAAKDKGAIPEEALMALPFILDPSEMGLTVEGETLPHPECSDERAPLLSIN